MPRLAGLYFKTAIVFLLIGIAMGLQMSISGNHNVIGAHAHANLLGWVTMAIFGGYHALNPAKAQSRLANLQYWIYTTGVVIIVPTLYLMYLGHTVLEPLAAIGSLIILLGAAMFAMVIFGKETQGTAVRGKVAV